MNLKKYNVDSFNLDHRAVKAPYVRLASRKTGAKGDVVSKFDIRVTQPNVEFMETGAIHALEHIAAETLRDVMDGVIDFSPMGCRTGFYLTLWGEISEENVASAMLTVFQKVVDWKGEVPAANEIQCGNFRDLDLERARFFAEKWIKGINEKGFSTF